MEKPLYGLSEIPLRWFVASSACLREHKYQKRRPDICVFAKRLHRELVDIIALYVDDILAAYDN